MVVQATLIVLVAACTAQTVTEDPASVGAALGAHQARKKSDATGLVSSEDDRPNC